MSEAEEYRPDPAEIAADLEKTGIHVDPALDETVTEEQQHEIHGLAEDADTPVFVIAVPLDHGSDVSTNQLVALVHREFDEDGVFFVSRGSIDFGWSVDSTTYGVRTDNEEALATYVAGDRYPSDLGLQLVDTVEVFGSGNAEKQHAETFPERQTSESESAEPAASILGMDVPVAIGGAVVLVVAAVGAWLLGRRRHRRGELELKRRALRRISSAQTREWRRRAETETAGLGDRINQLEIGQGADNEAWTAAIDHYQAATSVLDRSQDAADSIGATVLARRGGEALDRAVAGKPWEPTLACYFNPLHGHAGTRASWTTPAGSREVPCCATCRRHIDKRREPEILDLPTETTVVHYMDSGAEPWASTGYGALTPDLLGELQRS